MAESWTRHLRSQEEPETCPVCQKPASTQRKVAPFCCVMHRTKYTNDRRKIDFEQLVAHLAEVGDLIDNDGVVCCVKSVGQAKTVSGKGVNRVESYDATHVTWCGQVVDYPTMLKGAHLNCIGCISQGAEVRCLSP